MYHPPQLYSYGTLVHIAAHKWVEHAAKYHNKEKSSAPQDSYQPPELIKHGSINTVVADRPTDPCSNPMPPPWCE